MHNQSGDLLTRGMIRWVMTFWMKQIWRTSPNKRCFLSERITLRSHWIWDENGYSLSSSFCLNIILYANEVFQGGDTDFVQASSFPMEICSSLLAFCYCSISKPSIDSTTVSILFTTSVERSSKKVNTPITWVDYTEVCSGERISSAVLSSLKSCSLVIYMGG